MNNRSSTPSRILRAVATEIEGRALHVLDIENLAGQPVPSGITTSRIRTWYYAQDFCRAGDHFVGACNHLASKEVGFSWTGLRWRIRSGADGADLALLEAIDEARAAERFSRIVIASGDGIFAPVAAALATGGVEVTVVSDPAALSRRLKLAASRFVPCTPNYYEPQVAEGSAA